MHQTFYVDIDEEITSVVERLRKARASEIALVVPKRALLIQSIVNLRLLKKEADNLGLSIMMVTQDKLGKLLIEKAGILVQQKFDDLDQEETTGGMLPGEDLRIMDNDLSEEVPRTQSEERDRLARIGSDSYFNASEATEEKRRPSIDLLPKITDGVSTKTEPVERLTNKELVTGVSRDIRDISRLRPVATSPVVDMGDISAKKTSVNKADISQRSQIFPEEKRTYPKEASGAEIFQDKKIESFFSQKRTNEEVAEEKKETPVQLSKEIASKKTGRYVLWFGVTVFAIILLVVSYFILPKASILVSTKNETKSQQTKISGKIGISQIEYENEAIPLQEVSIAEEFSRNFPVSGEKTVSNQKARGKVTLYNEFSSSPQSLVATTRLLSEDGKLFRLVKGVTIPGTKKEGESVQAGTVEADVAADEAGEDFNINPGKFTIPGFKDSGSGKYEKIYAKSEAPMGGGGKGTGTSSAKTLTQDDVTKAKNEVISNLDAFVAGKIAEKAGPQAKVLEGLIKKSEPVYKISNSPGEVVSSFDISIKVEGEALVFSESDAKKLAGKILAKSGNARNDFSKDSISLDYISSKADFENKSADIAISINGKINPSIDAQTIKKGILGKTNSELETYLGSYPDIEKVEVTYWPPFLSSKIPLWERRVEVNVK
jgi:hypothetical protein